MIISCGYQRLVGSARQCPTLAVWALRLGVPKVAAELLPWPVGVTSMGWCSKKLSQNPHWGGVLKVGVVLQKVVPESSMGWCWVVFQKVVPESSMGWCSKRWGGVPKSCPRILDGVVFQKLGWCSKSWGVFQKVVPESPLCLLLYERTFHNICFIKICTAVHKRRCHVFTSLQLHGGHLNLHKSIKSPCTDGSDKIW